jgi:murein DD-endopeptidase MepM/ murein hydrolase activator NlpD
MRRAVVVSIVVLLAVAAWAEESPTKRFEAVAERMVKALNAGDYTAIERDFAKIMRDAFPLAKSKPFYEKIEAQLGKSRKLNPPRFIPPNQAIFPTHFERGVLDIKIVLDGEDKIAGLWFLAHTPDIPVPERHETPLVLPFRGAWFVFWGGDTTKLNQHHPVTNQRYAFDFVVTDTAGKSHKGEGRANEDYYAFGKEILAPADGTVTDVIEGVRDNVPGSMNPYSALGNAVFIQHREHEVSVMAHFKLGSVRVKVGDRVTAGQPIGLCGNSGNSSEPHLHHHLQNTPIIQDGTGIKCYFEKVVLVKGAATETKLRYSPIKGDIVRAE